MKKIAIYVMTAAMVLTTAGCQKISDLVTGKTTTEQGLVDDRGKKLTVDEQKAKVEETANILMADLDKSVWEAEYEKVMNTVAILDQKEVDATVIQEKLNAIVDLWTSVTGENPNEVTKTLAKISDFKGHFTENAAGGFDYTEADDLQITVKAGENTVTITYTATDSDIVYTLTEKENGSYLKAYVPKKVLSTLILGNEQLAALEVNLDPKDVNGDGVWEEDTDKVNIGYALTVGSYTMKIEQAEYATENAKASVKLFKGKDLVIGMNAKAVIKMEEVTVEDEAGSYTEPKVTPVSAEVTLDLAGKMQFMATVPDFAKLEEASNNVGSALESKNEEAIAAAAAEFEKLLGVGVYYDGKNTLQATVGFEPFKEGENWDVLPVLRFADGTTYTMEDFTKDQKFADIANNVMNWFQEMMDYLGIKTEPDA